VVLPQMPDADHRDFDRARPTIHDVPSAPRDPRGRFPPV
jgi:hypothetical protein